VFVIFLSLLIKPSWSAKWCDFIGTSPTDEEGTTELSFLKEIIGNPFKTVNLYEKNSTVDDLKNFIEANLDGCDAVFLRTGGTNGNINIKRKWTNDEMTVKGLIEAYEFQRNPIMGTTLQPAVLAEVTKPTFNVKRLHKQLRGFKNMLSLTPNDVLALFGRIDFYTSACACSPLIVGAKLCMPGANSPIKHVHGIGWLSIQNPKQKELDVDNEKALAYVQHMSVVLTPSQQNAWLFGLCDLIQTLEDENKLNAGSTDLYLIDNKLKVTKTTIVCS